MKKEIFLKACVLAFSATLLLQQSHANAMNTTNEKIQNIELSEDESVKVGQVIETSDNFKYKVLSIENGQGTVQFGDGENYISYKGEELTIPEKIIYQGIEFKVTEIASYAFSNYSDEFYGTLHGPNIKILTIPNSVVTIQDKAFQFSEYINEVKFNQDSQLQNIDDKAFYISKIKKIILPNSVEFIGNQAFSFCEHLSEFVIQEESNLQTIGHEAFSKTIKLKKIFIPKHVDLIGNSAFSVTPSMQEIKVDKDNNQFADIDGVLYNKSISELIRYPSKSERIEMIIPDSVQIIKQYSFDNSLNLNKVVFGKGIKEIEPFAFHNAQYIEEIKLNEGLKHIGRLAFYNTISLKELTIPNSVNNYGKNAFHGLQNLETITFGKESKEFGNSVISGDTSFLKNIILKSKEIYLTSNTFDLSEEVKNKVKFTVYSEEAKSKLIEIGINPENIILLNDELPIEPGQPKDPELIDSKGLSSTRTNVRVNPNGQIIGILEQGSLVEGKYEEGSNWVKFDYNGKEAYVYKPLLSETVNIKGLASGTTNVRKTPNGEIIGTAKFGETVTGIVSVDNPNWIKTDKGYIYKDLVVNTIKLRGLAVTPTNVRHTPNGQIIGSLAKAVYVEGTVNINNPNWVRIKYNNKDAYIYRSLIENIVSVQAIVKGNLNVRENPNGKILGTLTNGTLLKGKVSVKYPNWIEFQYKGQKAFVYKAYVK